MFKTIIEEMTKGNFSFLILVVGVIQTVLMSITLYLTIKRRNKK